MGCAFGVWNSTEKTLWFVLRSSDESGVILKVPVGKHKMVRLEHGEVVSSNIFEDEGAALRTIGIGEKDKFQHVVAEH
jgi:hypothetical protein